MTTTVRDDRVLPLTRWSAVVLIAALLAGGITLYGFPGSTAQVWAWTISPHMTALVMGAGYLSSSYFFATAALTREWHHVELGFLGVFLFAVLLLVATLLHWDRFAHGHPVFWAWLALYVVAPVLVPAFWLRNRPRAAPPSAADPRVPLPVRNVVALAGAVQLAVAAVLFVAPGVAVAVWPWTLTALTARVVAGFLAATAVILLVFRVEARWSAVAAGVRTAAIGIVLILLAVPRAAGDFAGPGALWGFVALLVVELAICLAPALAMRRLTASAARDGGAVGEQKV